MAYEPPSMTITQPFVRAVATFFLPLFRSFQRVLRETPISPAASSCFKPSRSTNLMASSSSIDSVIDLVSLPGGPHGPNLFIGGIPEIHLRPLRRPLPCPGIVTNMFSSIYFFLICGKLTLCSEAYLDKFQEFFIWPNLISFCLFEIFLHSVKRLFYHFFRHTK